MRHVGYAIVIVTVGLLVEGLINVSVADILVVLAIPFVCLYRLLGRRPRFLRYVGNVAMFAGAVSAIYGFAWAPTRYYYGLWGWSGILLGVIAAVVVPLQPIVLLATAFIKGGAAIPIAKLLSGICFGIAGRLLSIASATPPIFASNA
jgi:hypothetical protein